MLLLCVQCSMAIEIKHETSEFVAKICSDVASIKVGNCVVIVIVFIQ